VKRFFLAAIFLIIVSPYAGSFPRTIDLSTEPAGLTLYGQSISLFGYAVAAGDINGDGIDDLIIGAYSTPYGSVYVVFGRRNLGGSIDFSVEAPDILIQGGRRGYDAGWSVGAGDINGDGYDDIFIGSPRGKGPDRRRSEAGEVVIIFGSASLPAFIDLGNGEQDVIIYGDDYEGLGVGNFQSVDLNQDGIDDLIIGNPDGRGPHDNPRTAKGEVHVFFGRANWPTSFDFASETADVSIFGEKLNYVLGYCVAVLDFNRDSINDLFAGSPYAEHPDPALNKMPGKGYFLFGRQAWPQVFDLALENADVQIIGRDSLDKFGMACCAGDFNGDGVDELVVGAYEGDGPGNSRSDCGEVYGFLNPGPVTPIIDLAAADPGLTIYGKTAGDRMPSILLARDLNHDGYDDLIIGDDLGFWWTGEAYVIFGRSDLAGTIDLAFTDPDVLIRGADPDDHFGRSIAAGDFNGDGGVDLLLGAPAADGPSNDRTGAGEAYVIFGEPVYTGCLTFDHLRSKIDEAVVHLGLNQSMKEKVQHAEEKYNIGQVKVAGNILCALIHEIEAQRGKKISADSADQLIQCIREIAQNFQIPIRCLDDEDSDESGDESSDEGDDIVLRCRKGPGDQIELRWVPEDFPALISISSNKTGENCDLFEAEQSPYFFDIPETGEVTYINVW
jgi:hypothetical protein